MEHSGTCGMFQKPASLSHRISREFIEAGKEHRALLEKRLGCTGVCRGQHQTLMGIWRNPGLSQKELAEAQNVSTAAVAVALKKLEKGGYIERMADEKDSRCNSIHITEKGHDVLETSVHIFMEVEEEILAGFSEEERAVLFQYLSRLRNNIRNSLASK